MATLDRELINVQTSLENLRESLEKGDAEGMYESCRVALGGLSRMMARCAILMDLRKEAGYAAEVDRALNRK